MIKTGSLQVKDQTKLLEQQSTLKAKKCSLCSYAAKLRKEFLFPVASSGTGRILVVGSQTFIEEHKNTIACSGPFRTIFTNYLTKFTGLNETDCTFSYAVKCTDTNKNNPIKAKTPEFKNCSRYLAHEVKIIDPIITIFLGKDAAKSLIDNRTRNNTPTGVVFQTRILGKQRNCYFMTNPLITKTTISAVPIVEAQFQGLYTFFDQETDLYDNLTRPLFPKTDIKLEREYVLVNTIDKLKQMWEDLKDQTYVGMDTETTGLEIWKDDFKVVGISLAATEDKGYYIPIYHEVSGVPQLSWENQVKPVIEKIVRDPSKQTVWHNLYYDYAALQKMGVDIFKINPKENIWTHDSMLMTYLHNENVRIGLKEQIYLHFNIIPKKFKGVLQNADVNTFQKIDPKDALKYACDDAINALMLFKKTKKLVKEESDKFTDKKLLEKVYPDELQVIKILADAHLKGIRIDIDYLQELDQVVSRDLRETKNKIYKLSTTLMNISSNPKLIEFIESLLAPFFLQRFKKKFKKMTAQEKVLKVLLIGYEKIWNLAEKGAMDVTTKRVFEKPGKWAPAKLRKYIELVVRYRHLLKMKSTYINSINDLKHKVDKDTWLIHANIKSIGTTSGRMSSNKPNLQNIPRAVPKIPNKCTACDAVFKDDMGIKEDAYTADQTKSRYTCTKCEHVNKTYIYDLRRLYVPRKGMKFIAADYQNMELYLAAAVSGCQELYDVFLKKQRDPEDPNGDMHVVTAAAILGITPDQWKALKDSNKENQQKKAKETRTIAKTVNFLTLYGGSAAGLQEVFTSLGFDKTKEDCAQYIQAFFNTFPAIKKWFDDQKYNVQNYGRLINSYGRIRHVLKEGSETLSAINMLIQGLGAQIIKESLIAFNNSWKNKQWYPLLVIHDENIIEIPETDVKDAAISVKELMEVQVENKLNVDLKVDISEGISSLSKTEMK